LEFSFLQWFEFVSSWFAGSLRFPGILGFYESFQVRQARAPETSILLDPGIDGAKWFGIELVNPVPAFAMLSHQMGAAQQAQVLGDRGSRDRECLGDLSRRLAAPAQQVEDGAARGIGKGLEGGLRIPGG
jgi:hypothetical protein